MFPACFDGRLGTARVHLAFGTICHQCYLYKYIVMLSCADIYQLAFVLPISLLLRTITHNYSSQNYVQYWPLDGLSLSSAQLENISNRMIPSNFSVFCTLEYYVCPGASSVVNPLIQFVTDSKNPNCFIAGIYCEEHVHVQAKIFICILLIRQCECVLCSGWKWDTYG